MFDVKAFWGAKNEIQASLDKPFYFIVSVNDPKRGLRGGRVAEVTRSIAAEFIAKGTHELAKPEDIKRYKSDEEEKRKEIIKAERFRLAMLGFGRFEDELRPAAEPEVKK